MTRPAGTPYPIRSLNLDDSAPRSPGRKSGNENRGRTRKSYPFDIDIDIVLAQITRAQSDQLESLRDPSGRMSCLDFTSLAQDSRPDADASDRDMR